MKNLSFADHFIPGLNRTGPGSSRRCRRPERFALVAFRGKIT
jgi:hypothetical protein